MRARVEACWSPGQGQEGLEHGGIARFPGIVPPKSAAQRPARWRLGQRRVWVVGFVLDNHELDEFWMRQALSHADAATDSGDVPIGAIVVSAKNQLIGAGCNRRERDQDPTAHAEIVALRAAAAAQGRWYLDGSTLYSTLEPCPMCAGALVNARIGRVVYGASDPKAGAITSVYTVGVDGRLNHRVRYTDGVLSEECLERVRSFFLALRAEGKK